MLRVTGLLLALCLTVSSHSCPRGWTVNDGTCYGYGGAKVSFGDALSICLAYGAKLVEVETYAESEYLKRLIKDKGGWQVWIAANDIFHDGIWEWTYSGNLVYPFTDWFNGQPDDYKGEEECAAIWEGPGGDRFNLHWNDAPCTFHLNFICEKRL